MATSPTSPTRQTRIRRRCRPGSPTCSVLLGYRPTDIAGTFRYADLGCGNGLSALIVAATNPHAEVWGFDFNPAHVENARVMAAQRRADQRAFRRRFVRGAGARRCRTRVRHHRLAWRAELDLAGKSPVSDGDLGRRLLPGGLAYLSYNVATGWSDVEPVRLLMRQLAEADQRRTDLSIPGIFQTVDQLRSGGAAFFRERPGLDARLDANEGNRTRAIWRMNSSIGTGIRSCSPKSPRRWRRRGPATSAARRRWRTSMPSRCRRRSFRCSNNIRDAVTRETVRDLACAKNFRRDLWRKGAENFRSGNTSRCLTRSRWRGRARQSKPIDLRRSARRGDWPAGVLPSAAGRHPRRRPRRSGNYGRCRRCVTASRRNSCRRRYC